MNSLLNAEFFRGNRTALRKLFTGTAPIVITAAGLLQRSGDSAFPFQQDSSFWYLTGINEPDVTLVIDKDREYLIAPDRGSNQETFDGAIDNESLSEISGIKTVWENKNGWKLLSSRLKKVRHIATLSAPPGYIADHSLYTNPARTRLIGLIKDCNSEAELLDLRQHMTHLRMVKQHAELAIIQSSIDITIETLKNIIKKRSSFESEYEIEAEISRTFRRSGAVHGYTPIVAGGKNACTLHYINNNDNLNPKDLLLIDVGAEISHYSADITRTIAFKEPSRRQQAIFDAVIEVQNLAKSLIKPGVLLKDYERTVAEFMGEKLRELGLIRSIDSPNIHNFFPHSTSHFLGLDVHDTADYLRPLEPGMVLTVEPGIYVPQEGIGIRIEDDVVVTQDGIEIMTSKLGTSLW